MFAQLAERLRRCSVKVGGGGSGVIWSSDGLIITNAHVTNGHGTNAHVARERELAVTLGAGARLPGRLVARDARRDLAAVRVEATGLPVPNLGTAANLRPGQLVIAVGNPFGITGVVTSGIIHTAGPLRVGGESWIQADVSLAPGNSGGLLADAEGNIIGINTMIFAGLALAVPVNEVAAFLARNGERVAPSRRAA